MARMNEGTPKQKSRGLDILRKENPRPGDATIGTKIYGANRDRTGDLPMI